jgi:hypothetical protein
MTLDDEPVCKDGILWHIRDRKIFKRDDLAPRAGNRRRIAQDKLGAVLGSCKRYSLAKSVSVVVYHEIHNA